MDWWAGGGAGSFGLYERIGYPVLYTSAADSVGIDELRELLTGRITVVTGPSGVGKSSLLNAVHPDLNLRTGDLRDFPPKGGIPHGRPIFAGCPLAWTPTWPTRRGSAN